MRINIEDYVKKEKAILKGKINLFSINNPTLLILQHGDDPASNFYVQEKIKDAKECGIEAMLFKTDSASTLLNAAVSNIKFFDGIILQESHNLTWSYTDKIFKTMEDYQNVGGIGSKSIYTPCAPKGIMDIIAAFYPKENIEGEVVIVVGKDESIDKPLISLLMKKGCTVISCNSKTADLGNFTKMADIVISAVGKENLITRDMLKDGAFVIDAGITFDENGKICGDCDKAIYDDEQIAITTVPDGVDLIKRLILMKNTFEAFKIRRNGI